MAAATNYRCLLLTFVLVQGCIDDERIMKRFVCWLGANFLRMPAHANPHGLRRIQPSNTRRNWFAQALNNEMACPPRSGFMEMTKKQIEDSPPLDSDKLVSRQFEEVHYGFYGWPSYWNGSSMWGANPLLLPKRTNSLAIIQPAALHTGTSKSLNKLRQDRR